jgi:hypothetical protein
LEHELLMVRRKKWWIKKKKMDVRRSEQQCSKAS